MNNKASAEQLHGLVIAVSLLHPIAGNVSQAGEFLPSVSQNCGHALLFFLLAVFQL